jgi:sec-independent protein translocase protein TatC
MRAGHPEEYQQSLGEHLVELRARFLRAGAALTVTTVASLGWSRYLLSFLLRPVPETFFFSPGEAFAAHLRIAFMIGLPLAWPFVLYQAYSFVAPGLYRGERRALAFLLPLGTLLFVLGLGFGYLVMIPVVLIWLRGFAAGGITAAISVSLYTSFVVNSVVPFGVVFQLPLVASVLSRLGVISAGSMARARRWVYLGMVVLAALLTPPDVVSQALMAFPMILLYELSILIARYTAPRSLRERP